MNQLAVSLLIGIIAGIIDIIPMIILKLDIMFILSAFTMWVSAGLFISKASFTGIYPLNGLITALLIFIPMFFLIYRLDRDALPKICTMTVLLGLGMGFLYGLFVR